LKDCPKCFYGYDASPECKSCIYAGSCSYATENKMLAERKNNAFRVGTVEYIEIEGDEHPNKVELPTIITDFINDDSETEYTKNQVIAIISIILRFSNDRVIRSALAEKVSTGDSITTIAKRMNISRQYLHRKIAEQFALIFGFKQNRVKDSSLLKLDAKEFLVYKYHVKQGLTLRETAEITGIQKSTIHYIRTKLARKKSKYWTKKKRKKKN